MTVKKGVINKNTVSVSAGWDSVTIRLNEDGTINIYLGGQYIKSDSVRMDSAEAIELARQLTLMACDG